MVDETGTYGLHIFTVCRGEQPDEKSQKKIFYELNCINIFSVCRGEQPDEKSQKKIFYELNCINIFSIDRKYRFHRPPSNDVIAIPYLPTKVTVLI